MAPPRSVRSTALPASILVMADTAPPTFEVEMSTNSVAVFFYGLFMDEALLASKGVHPIRVANGYVDGLRLRICSRATLVSEEGSRAYGVLMEVRSEDVGTLYADESVADYVPEPVAVVLADGSKETATCYNLPLNKLQGTNPQYAAALHELAEKLHFPNDYLEQIRRQTD